MPPKKMTKLPSLAERKKIMEELEAAGKSGDALNQNEQYKEYVNKLKALNELMDKYSAIDENYGIPETLTEQGKKELTEAMFDMANAGETFLAAVENQKGNVNAGIAGVVGRVQDMLAKDYDMLNNYQPDKTPMSFPELQQDARTQVIDFRGKKLGIMGNMQSSRIPMTVVDAKGVRRQGVFTKASYVNVKGKLGEVLNRAASRYDRPAFLASAGIYKKALLKKGAFPQGTKPEEVTDEMVVSKMKEQVTGVLLQYRQNLMDKGKKIDGVAPEKVGDEQLIGELYYQIGRKKSVKGVLSEIGVKTDEMDSDVLDVIEEGIVELCKDPSHYINASTLGLKDNDRLDQRNSAMSAVAGLLGMPEIIARSTNMKYLDENGTVVEGTFMEFSNGLDLLGKKGAKEFSKVCDDPFGQPCLANKSIADLQILDYICGNTDRHGGNMTYQVDKNGKIIGVQGIDNDSSFGVTRPGKDRGYNRLVGTDNLKVISASAANKISKISKEMLKFTLRGQGLNEKEIKAACQRLGDLKEAIKNAKVATNITDVMSAGKQLCIMKTEDLVTLPANALKHSNYNLFKDVIERVDYARENARGKYPFDPEAAKKQSKSVVPKLAEVSTTDRKYAAGGIAESMSGMARMIKNEVTGFEVSGLSKFLRSSGKFRAMISAVKEANKIAKQISGEIKQENEGLLRDDPKVKAQLERADKAMERAKKATQEYLERKMKEKNVTTPEELVGKGKSEYEQKRIDYALKVMENVKAYEQIKNPQTEEAGKQKEAVIDSLKMAGKRKELKQPDIQPGALV